MVKPVYLYDLVRDDFSTVEADGNPRVLGRAMGCDLVTSAEFGGIDKYQAEIRYFPNRTIKLTQKSSLSRTDYSFDGGEWDQLFTGRTEIIFPGSSIRFDEQYIIRVLTANDELVRDRIAAREAEVFVREN